MSIPASKTWELDAGASRGHPEFVDIFFWENDFLSQTINDTSIDNSCSKFDKSSFHH